MKPDLEIARVSLPVFYFRIISELIFRLFFPRTFIDKSKALQKACNAALEGKGLVIVYTHFSLRDAMEINRSIIFKDPVFRKRKAVNPLSYHQYNKFMELMAKSYGGDFYPVVNNSTVTKKGFEHLPKGKGLKEFTQAGSKILSAGGVVTLAVNATRKDHLDIQDPQKPIGYFIASTQALGVTNYGFLLVGFSIKNAKNYKKEEVGGMNIGKRYTINIAKYISLSELLHRPEVKEKLSNVDAYIRSEFTKVVAKEYL